VRIGAPPVRGKGSSHPLGSRLTAVRTFFLPVLSGHQAHLEEGKMTPEFPRRRGFEQLKKDAKHWLTALRKHDREALARFSRKY
jgi:hypothetical protein